MFCSRHLVGVGTSGSKSGVDRMHSGGHDSEIPQLYDRELLVIANNLAQLFGGSGDSGGHVAHASHGVDRWASPIEGRSIWPLEKISHQSSLTSSLRSGRGAISPARPLAMA
jgi:hypothetical protein